MLALLVAVCGCWGNQEPCSDVRKGDQLSIELVSLRLTEDLGEGECFTPWGISPGMTLEATVLGLANSAPCRAGAAEIDGVENWTWTRVRSSDLGSGTIKDLYDVQSGECSGRALLKLSTDYGLDCPDGRCGLTLIFDPSFDAEDCPPYCGGYFDVRVERLQ
jgi:hypothetical protein